MHRPRLAGPPRAGRRPVTEPSPDLSPGTELPTPDLPAHPRRPGRVRRRLRRLQPDPLDRPGRHVGGAARRDRARHVHDGARRARARLRGRGDPGRVRDVRRAVHQAGGRARRRRGRRGHGRRRSSARSADGRARIDLTVTRAGRRCSARRARSVVPSTDRRPSRRLVGADHVAARRPADELVEATTEQTLVDAVAAADAAAQPVLVLGGGSNLVVADEGFPGRVVRVAHPRACTSSPTCAAGARSGRGRRGLGRARRARRRRGLDRASRRCPASPARSGPPRSRTSARTARRSPRRSPRCVPATGSSAGTRTFAAADCGFGYRTSRFKADPAASSCSR